VEPKRKWDFEAVWQWVSDAVDIKQLDSEAFRQWCVFGEEKQPAVSLWTVKQCGSDIY
jgi:hypothetical protein